MLMVVAVHSAMAYVATNPALQPRYDPPPLISDSHRSLAFDLFCASQYVYLMQFMFLLSAVFVWPSLRSRGIGNFLYNRFLRLGLPFLIGVYLLMPIADYPIYRLGMANPSWSDYWAQRSALSFWPGRHLWFLWYLFALDIAAAAVYAFAPRAIERLGRVSASAREHPVRYFLALLAASALVYVPLSMKFMPWDWMYAGPFQLQKSLAAVYAVYFFAGIAIGSCALDSGLFAVAGKLPQRWIIWLLSALAGFLLWIIPTGLSMETGTASAIRVIAGVGLIVACTTACFALAAIFLRLAKRPSRVLAPIADNAFGIYFFHFGFALWLQYLLLDLPLLAAVKFAIVCTASLILSWLASATVSRGVLGLGLLPERRSALANPAASLRESR